MQSIYPYQFDQMMEEVRQIAEVVGRTVNKGANVAQIANSAD
jgi:hypothetical protein